MTATASAPAEPTTAAAPRSALTRAIWRPHVFAGLLAVRVTAFPHRSRPITTKKVAMTTASRRLALSGLLCLLSAPALAHAHLKSATPAINGAVSTAPAELDLTFSEGVNPKFSGVTVSGPDGKAVPLGQAKLGASGDTTLVVPLAATLAAGAYKVSWHALANDGHKTTGTYTFTVAP